jgi:CBS domain-containing protein
VTKLNGIGLRGEVEELLGTVDDVARRSVVRLSPHQTIGEAARELEEQDVSGAPVVDRNRVIGMVTLKDLFAAAGVPPSMAATSGPWHRYERDLDATGLTVEKVMTRMVLTLPVGTPVAEAASVMRGRGVNRIPIVDRDGVVVAILARDDIIEAVARTLERIRRTRH